MKRTVEMILLIALFTAASVAQAVCSTTTINPGAVQAIRPHMTPAAVSAVLGCAPTEIGPLWLWIWGVPLVDEVVGKIQVAVVFDEEGVLSAHYQVIPISTGPAGNSALRVEPGVPTYGTWVPGVVAR